MGSNIAILGSAGTPYQTLVSSLEDAGLRVFYLGGSLECIYSRLFMYRDELHRSDTILLFNVVAEDLAKLDAWPAIDRTLLPVSLKQFAAYELPFAFLTERDGRIRGIVVGRTSQEIETLVQIMAQRPVPVGVPWSVRPVVVAAGPASEPWYVTRSTVESGAFRVSYLPRFEADARTMLTWADDVLRALRVHFPEAGEFVHEPVTLWLHGEGELDPGYAYADVGSATLHFTAPSVAARHSSYYDLTWYRGNIAHEYAHIFFDRMRRRAGGYGTDPGAGGAPRWFQEGLGEYFRLLVIGEETFERNYGSRYGSQINFLLGSSLDAAPDVYAAGAWALRFLDDWFGPQGIRRIVTSSQPTFWDAVREATGLTRAEFEQAFRDWLWRYV